MCVWLWDKKNIYKSKKAIKSLQVNIKYYYDKRFDLIQDKLQIVDMEKDLDKIERLS